MEDQGTRILTANDENIKLCGELIRQGKLVAMPTETVYGLGANALNPDACLSIFKAKGRPLTDPLIVHVHSIDQAKELIDMDQSLEVISLFENLAAKFWPGPLTLVVKANLNKIPSLITADTGYVGLRLPAFPLARRLLEAANKPIAAPSANKFGHISPSKAQHVYDDFANDGISEVAILDGGSCSFGIESTVLKLSYDEKEQRVEMLILRHGGVSEDALKAVAEQGDQTLQLKSKKHSDFKPETENLEGPGQFLRHYAPNIDSYLYSGSELDMSEAVMIDFGATFKEKSSDCKYYTDLSESGSYSEAIANLYDKLRWAET